MTRQPPARDAKHYVHGLDGAGVVLVPARVACWLHQRLPLDHLRTEVRGADPEVDHVLLALSVAGLNWRSCAFATGPTRVPQPQPRSAWLTSSEAADLLEVTGQAVRKACLTGRLQGERVGGRWRISRENF